MMGQVRRNIVQYSTHESTLYRILRLIFRIADYIYIKYIGFDADIYFRIRIQSTLDTFIWIVPCQKDSRGNF